MASQGDDCYFYYYSTCVKGEECPFRHQPEALGCEVVCEEWEKSRRCLKPVCRFRHMLIEERRSRTQCYWESQPSGCLKPFCPFLHTKPRPNEQTTASTTSVPTVSQPAQPLPVPPIPVPPSSATKQDVRTIPTISNTPRPRQPLLQNVSVARQSAAPISYPTMPNRLVLAPQPPQMIRTPHYTGPPRPAGMVQPVPVGRGFAPVLPHVPVRYGRGMPAPQRFPHPLNNIYVGGPEGSATSFLSQGGFQEDRFDRQDSDSYSSSESDDERRKSHQTSRRKVRNSSQREVFSSNRRDIHSNRKQQSNKPSRERYRTGDRRRPDGSKDRKKDCTDAEREKSRDRRRPSRRSDKETEEKERKDNIERQRRKTSPSQDEKNEEKTEKEDMAKDESSPGFKVKTLEEILREKALKKLEERRAQAKIEEQKEAEDGKEEREEENMGKGEGANKSEEEESVVLESESNAKHLFDEKDSNSVEPSFEKPSVARKVSLNEKKRSPVKKVVGLKKNFIDSKSSSTADSSSEEVTQTKRVSANSEENENVNEKVTTNEPPSPFQEVRVKSFEEIMQEKRKRKAEQEGARDSVQDLGRELTEQVNSSTAIVTSIPPKRLKRLVRKSSEDSDKDTKVVSSSAADTDNKVENRRKRTVYVMDKPSSSKDSKENDVTSTASNGENKPPKASLKKQAAAAECLGQQKVRVKSRDEIMSEKRQRASQERAEAPKDSEVAGEEERGLKNSPRRNQERKPLKRVSVPVIKPRRIKVWGQGTNKQKSTEDSVSSSTVEETHKDQESREQAVQIDIEALKLPAFQSEPALAESQLRPADASVKDQRPAPDQRIPNKDGSVSTAASDVEAGAAICEFGVNTVAVEADDFRSKITQITQEPEEVLDSPEKPQHSLSEQHDMEDTEPPMEYQPSEPKGSKEPPSYDEIKQAIANEMAKKDDFFDEFGADIDLGEDDGVAGDSFELNEDDLLMELDEMINQ